MILQIKIIKFWKIIFLASKNNNSDINKGLFKIVEKYFNKLKRIFSTYFKDKANKGPFLCKKSYIFKIKFNNSNTNKKFFFCI